ncbi:MAG: TIGR03936 family radical SAM-associated protein [Peptococcaceae bacterium]|nr:TIGR03936 family radical SAM-associated protein [Peptococcaceae bacterium]
MPVYRICFQKTGPAAYLSHLDLLRVMERAARRAGLPLAYSGGFNPHPRMAFAAPLPVGISGEQELADIELTGEVDPVTITTTFNRCLPEGLLTNSARRVEGGGPSLMAQVQTAAYRLTGNLAGPLTTGELDRVIQTLLARETIAVTRLVKGKTRTANIRPGIVSLTGVCRGLALELFLAAAIGVRPGDVLAALVTSGLPTDPALFTAVRQALFGSGPLT